MLKKVGKLLGNAYHAPWEPQAGASVDIDFVSRQYYWGGGRRTEGEFVSFSGAVFGSGDNAGLVGGGTASAYDITLDFTAFAVSAPFVAAVVFRPTGINAAAQRMVDILATDTPGQNRTTFGIHTTNAARHTTVEGGVNQVTQTATGSLSNDTTYCMATLLATDLFRNSLSGATAGTEDTGGALPTYALVRFMESDTGSLPFIGSVRRFLIYPQTGGAEISQVDLNTLSTTLAGL